MYLQFFGLTEPPFSITPDPAFVYLSDAHREALAHLLYGVGQGGAGGFVQLTGEVGTGKTTICRCLLEQLPDHTRVALILNPIVTPRELVATICDELRVPMPAQPDSTKALVDALNEYLLREHAEGNRVVVIIDEAQGLSPDALEQVRLLTNLETAKDKLLQMVLLGQPELRVLLQRQNLRQLAQRITARYHLPPLNPEETSAYVRHRMQVAGAVRNPFTRSALRAVHRRSGGIPRLVNIISDRSLAAAYARESAQVTERMVHAAADEVQPSESRVSRRTWPAWLAAGVVFALAIVGWVVWDPLERKSSASTGRERATAQQPASVGDAAVAEAGAELPPTRQPVPMDDSNPVGDTLGGTGAQALAQVEQADPPEPAETQEPVPVAESASISGPESGSPESVIDSQWIDRQHDRAYADMAELWGDAGSSDAIRAACAGTPRVNYGCLRESGSWARVLQLGLPVILVLQEDDVRHVLLRGVEGDRLLLGLGTDARLVERQAVESLWLGEYLVAWRQAPDWPNQIRRGDSGDAVGLVLQMAALADPPWDGGERFDERFESWVMNFQRQHGLIPDGIIGPRTLIYLLAPGIGEPHLLRTLEEPS